MHFITLIDRQISLWAHSFSWESNFIIFSYVSSYQHALKFAHPSYGVYPQKSYFFLQPQFKSVFHHPFKVTKAVCLNLSFPLVANNKSVLYCCLCFITAITNYYTNYSFINIFDRGNKCWLCNLIKLLLLQCVQDFKPWLICSPCL